MLVVKLEIHPGGDEKRAREIGRLELARVPRGGLLDDELREEYQRRREAGELPRAIAADMGGRDLGSYQGHLTHEWGLDLDLDVPVFNRAKGGWALVLAALQALGPQVDMSHGRPGVVTIGKDAYGEPCVLFKDIPARAREAFESWIGGQSMPVTRQADGLGCYVEDYERWLRGPGLAWPEARLREEGGREKED